MICTYLYNKFVVCYTMCKKRRTMNLNYYTSISGKNLIMEYINSLTVEEQVDALSVLKNMQNGEFNKINFKRWEKKIYEVYFYKHNRIFYITVDNANIYLLHACRKQKNKTEKGDKKIVENRARQLGKELGKKFI